MKNALLFVWYVAWRVAAVLAYILAFFYLIGVMENADVNGAWGAPVVALAGIGGIGLLIQLFGEQE